jgi:hypothetical protein
MGEFFCAWALSDYAEVTHAETRIIGFCGRLRKLLPLALPIADSGLLIHARPDVRDDPESRKSPSLDA